MILLLILYYFLLRCLFNKNNVNNIKKHNKYNKSQLQVNKNKTRIYEHFIDIRKKLKITKKSWSSSLLEINNYKAFLKSALVSQVFVYIQKIREYPIHFLWKKNLKINFKNIEFLVFSKRFFYICYKGLRRIENTFQHLVPEVFVQRECVKIVKIEGNFYCEVFKQMI